MMQSISNFHLYTSDGFVSGVRTSTPTTLAVIVRWAITEDGASVGDAMVKLIMFTVAAESNSLSEEANGY